MGSTHSPPVDSTFALRARLPITRIPEVLESPNQSLKGHRLGVRQQVELTLVLLGHNISQALAADMYGISQPTVSRVWRQMAPLPTHVPATSGIRLAQAVAQGSLLLIDGTPIPTGNRAVSSTHAAIEHTIAAKGTVE